MRTKSINKLLETTKEKIDTLSENFIFANILL